MTVRAREALFVDEGYVRTWGGDPAWAICPQPEVVREIAQGLAERDGRDPDDADTIEAYVNAIRDVLFDTVDELLFDIDRTARHSVPTDEAARVRLAAARHLGKRLAERMKAEPTRERVAA